MFCYTTAPASQKKKMMWMLKAEPGQISAKNIAASVMVKATTTDKVDARDLYKCPCYKTQDRGPTYVFTAGLKTKLPPAKWVMAGVALLMSVVE